MQINRNCIILFFITFINSVSLSQSVDEVIANYITAVGGIEKIKSIKTVKITSHLSQGNLNVPYVQYIKVPAKIRTEITRQGLTQQTAYNGVTGWRLNPFRGVKIPEKILPEEVKDLKESADFEGALIDYSSKGNKAEYMGIDDFEGSEVYKIKLTDSERQERIYLIDKNTNLILKKTVKRKIKEKEQRIDTYYSVYKPVEGYMFPFSVDVDAGGLQRYIIDKVEFNIVIDDAIFEMPEDK